MQRGGGRREKRDAGRRSRRTLRKVRLKRDSLASGGQTGEAGGWIDGGIAVVSQTENIPNESRLTIDLRAFIVHAGGLLKPE